MTQLATTEATDLVIPDNLDKLSVEEIAIMQSNEFFLKGNFVKFEYLINFLTSFLHFFIGYKWSSIPVQLIPGTSFFKS